MADFESLIDFMEMFPDDKTCAVHLERIRWDGNPVCPHCTYQQVYRYKSRPIFKCCRCQKQFSVRTGTIFEGSHISLRKWYIASYLFNNDKKGVSSCQLARTLKVTQKTAWFMLHRLREAMKDPVFQQQPASEECVYEMDETYIGQKSKNKHASKRQKNTQGRNMTDKVSVWGIINRNTGIVYSQPVENVKAGTLKPLVYEHVEPGATVYTDDWGAYIGLDKYYRHCVVSHGSGEYVSGVNPEVHTNNIENYWAQVKRSIMGCYHRPSRKHMSRYCYEWDFRFNCRDYTPGYVFDLVLEGAKNQRLTYKQLIT